MPRLDRWLYCGFVFLFFLAAVRAQAPGGNTGPSSLPPAARVKVDFERDIAPIFKQRCEVCHGAKQQSGGLRLDERNPALAGGYSGPVIKPGDSAGSKLIRLVSGLQKGMIMPLAGPRLTSEQVGLLRAWIDQGASWPAANEAAK